MSQINKPYGATNEEYYKDCERYAFELEARVKELEGVMRDFAVNYDCDSDAHRYNTSCRKCIANEALKGKVEP